jgi:ACS family tartrate transporter-like MFS transporter
MHNSAMVSEVGERARRRIARRIVPFLFISYVIAYLDRVNVGYAALEMKNAMGFSDDVFGRGAGIFFIGYFLLEIPGALLVERWSARRWFARIMISWGLITVLTAFIRGKSDFYGARVLLGAAEAGFFPGIIVYLTHWFRYEDRAKAVAGFMTAIALSNVFGSPLAGWLLGVSWFGIEGWRWLFIVEGIPAVVLGVVTLAYLTDWPHQARWLPEDEQRWIIGELEREKQAKKAARNYTVWQAFRNRDVILLALLYFLAVAGHYGFILWQPTILKRASGLPNFTITILASLPFLAGAVAMVLNGWHSDKTGERRWHAALPLFICAASFLASLGVSSQFWVTVVLFTLAGAALHAYLPSFWALPTIALSESAAAASIGLINSVGNLGGFAGPFIVGYLSSRTHSFSAGLFCLLSALFLAGVLVLLLRVHCRPAAQ